MTKKETKNTISETQLVSHPRRLKIFASMMYEGMLLMGLSFTGAYIFDSLTQSHDAERLMWQRQLMLFLIVGFYFIVCWRKQGQTLPMRTWDILLRSKLGSRLTWKQLIGRYLLMWVLPLIGAFIVYLIATSVGWKSINIFIIFCPFLNLIPTLFTKDRQMLHDVFVGAELINFKK